jgi:hypothetical protein
MTAISYITKKIMNMDNNVFSFNYDKSDPIKPLMKLLFISLVNNRHKGKFIMFKEQTNSFLKFSREEFSTFFCKIQKTYYAFSRLAFIYKYKKSSTSVTTDMCLNDITINDKNVLCIYHVNSRYLFNVNDLLKIITTSLTNSYMLFSQPLPSKNPYNNLPFTKPNLYNIYFFIKFNTHIYNDLFFKFFDCGFNLSSFYHKYEYLLRENIIKNIVKNSSEGVLVQEIKNMINSYNKKNKKILIHDEFPKKRLVQIMKPYLLLYLQSYYSFVPTIQNNTGILLNRKLKKFQKFNPRFGRKIYKLEFKYENFKKKSFIKSYEFIDKHIPFNYNEDNNFLTNHTYYSEIETTDYVVTVEINYDNEENTIVYGDDYDDDEDEDDEDEHEVEAEAEDEDDDDEIPWGPSIVNDNSDNDSDSDSIS